MMCLFACTVKQVKTFPVAIKNHLIPQIELKSRFKKFHNMARDNIKIVVHGDKKSSELEVLKFLPPNAKVIKIGFCDEIIDSLDEKELAEVDVLLNTSFGVTSGPAQTIDKLIAVMPSLKWLHCASAGVSHIIGDGLRKSDIVLTNAKGTFSHSLGEYAIASCMYFAKKISELQTQQKNKNWNPLYVDVLKGKQMGIIGYGDIGRTAGNMGKAFGMKIAALRRRTELSDAEAKEGLKVYTTAQINDLMATSDYVVAALPATDKTKGLIDATAISHMKKNAVFINLGRGVTVDEDALIQALSSKQILGAALDVFAVEPLEQCNPLWNLENVLVSPHCADRTTTFMHEAVEQFVKNCHNYLTGKDLQNVCDKEAGY